MKLLKSNNCFMNTDEPILPDANTIEVYDLVNTSELVSDYSFQYRIFQMNNILGLDIDNYGFCFET